DFSVASIQDGFCALAHTSGDQRFDALLAFFADDRSHLNAGFETVADANRRSRVGDGVAECFLGFANGDGDRYCKATLAGAAKRAVADDLGGEFHIGVGQNDDVIFCAALALHAFAAGCGARVDMPGNGGGTYKTDGTNLRMVTEGVHDFFSAVDQIYDAFGQAGFFQELESSMHREGYALRWLQNESI